MSTNWQNSEVREVVVMNKEDVVQVKEELADLGVELDKTKKRRLLRMIHTVRGRAPSGRSYRNG